MIRRLAFDLVEIACLAAFVAAGSLGVDGLTVPLGAALGVMIAAGALAFAAAWLAGAGSRRDRSRS